LPAYLQADLKDTEKLSLPGVRNDVPSFTTYLARYDTQHIPSSSAISNSSVVKKSSKFLFINLINKLFLLNRTCSSTKTN
jgi:hypothetical protein